MLRCAIYFIGFTLLAYAAQASSQTLGVLLPACEQYVHLSLAAPSLQPHRTCREACQSVTLPHALQSDEISYFCRAMCSTFVSLDPDLLWPPDSVGACARLDQILATDVDARNMVALLPEHLAFEAAYHLCLGIQRHHHNLTESIVCYRSLLQFRPHSPRILIQLAYAIQSFGAVASVFQAIATHSLLVAVELSELLSQSVSPEVLAIAAELPMNQHHIIEEFLWDSVNQSVALTPSHIAHNLLRWNQYHDILEHVAWRDIDSTSIDEAVFLYAWALQSQRAWVQLLPLAESRMRRDVDRIDQVYFNFYITAAQYLNNVTALQCASEIGEIVLRRLISEKQYANLHPFAALSWDFVGRQTDLALDLVQMVTSHYADRTTLPEIGWQNGSVARQNMLSVTRDRKRIRIGYLAMHFRRSHPIGNLMEFVLAAHDRQRFEIFCYALWSPVDVSLEFPFYEVCDHFTPCYAGSVQHVDKQRHPRVHRLSVDPSPFVCDGSAASLFHQLQSDSIQIAVDLDGYMELREPRIAALMARPAPIQVNYLGYPGTMTSHSSYLQYIIGDSITIPLKTQSSTILECAVRLPFSYFPTHHRTMYADTVAAAAGLHQQVFAAINSLDSQNASIDELSELRHRFGLPADRFLFACFNAITKLGAETWHAWMKILKAAPHSVLVLMRQHPVDSDSDRQVRINIEQLGAKYGVGPDRIMYLPRLAIADHLKRLSSMDLMLDSFPYNMHTTAADSLWAGVPVLTFPQRLFSGRVAASQLFATGCLTKLLSGEARNLDQEWRAESDLVSNPRSVSADSPRADVFLATKNFAYFQLINSSSPMPVHVVDFSSLSDSPHGRLAVDTVHKYIDMAVFLSYHSQARLAWRSCIEETRWNSPLFDSNRFARHLEVAYQQMWTAWVDEIAPRDITVGPQQTLVNLDNSMTDVYWTWNTSVFASPIDQNQSHFAVAIDAKSIDISSAVAEDLNNRSASVRGKYDLFESEFARLRSPVKMFINISAQSIDSVGVCFPSVQSFAQEAVVSLTEFFYLISGNRTCALVHIAVCFDLIHSVDSEQLVENVLLSLARPTCDVVVPALSFQDRAYHAPTARAQAWTVVLHLLPRFACDRHLECNSSPTLSTDSWSVNILQRRHPKIMVSGGGLMAWMLPRCGQAVTNCWQNSSWASSISQMPAFLIQSAQFAEHVVMAAIP